MADIATLGLKIDGSGAIKSIGDVEQKLTALGKRTAEIASKAGVAFGAAFVAGGALVIRNTIEQEKAIAALESRLASTGGVAGRTSQDLQQLASSLQSVSTFGDEAILKMQGVLLTFTQVRGDQFDKASQAILDMSTALGTDLQSSALQVGKALNDPIRGVTALARAGVQLTQDQKALVEQLQNTGDIAGAQAVILKELETQFGGAALAARNTLGGALVALKNAFGDLFEVPGLISPITAELNRLVAFMSAGSTQDAVKGFIQNVMVSFGVMGATVADVVGVVATSVGQIAGAFGRLSGADSPLNRFARQMQSVAEGAASASVRMEAIATAIARGTPPVVAATKAYGSLGDAISETATEMRELETVAMSSGNQMALFLQQFGGDGVARNIQGAKLALMEFKQEALEVVMPPAEALTGWQNFTGALANAFGQASEWITQNAQQMADTLLATFSRIAQRGKATLGDLFASLSQLGVGGAAGGIAFGAAAIVGDIIGGQRRRFEEAVAAVESKVGALASAFTAFGRSFEESAGRFVAGFQRISDFVEATTKEIDAILTVTARRFLSQAGGDAQAALAAAEQQAAQTGFSRPRAAVEQLKAYIKATDDLVAAQKRAREELERQRKEFNRTSREDLEVRRLAAMGRTEESDALRRDIERRREFAQAIKDGADVITQSLLLMVQAMEEAAIQAEREAERNRTVAGIDAEIARLTGNDAEAQRIERDILLAQVTDDVIRAKYEELFAIQDSIKAQQEVAEAAALMVRQMERSEDLEVRRLIATGNAIEAEELRFQLEQQREIRRAEAELARGEITQEIFDTLLEILELEASAFGNRNNPTESGAGAGAVAASRTTNTGPLQALATAQVADIDRVVGELTAIRVRAGQQVQLLQAIFRGGGVVGVINQSLQSDTTRQQTQQGNVVVS
jgi:hypothetical protein